LIDNYVICGEVGEKHISYELADEHECEHIYDEDSLLSILKKRVSLNTFFFFDKKILISLSFYSGVIDSISYKRI